MTAARERMKRGIPERFVELELFPLSAWRGMAGQTKAERPADPRHSPSPRLDGKRHTHLFE